MTYNVLNKDGKFFQSLQAFSPIFNCVDPDPSSEYGSNLDPNSQHEPIDKLSCENWPDLEEDKVLPADGRLLLHVGLAEATGGLPGLLLL